MYNADAPKRTRISELPNIAVNTPLRKVHRPPTFEKPPRNELFLTSRIMFHCVLSLAMLRRRVEIFAPRFMRGEVDGSGYNWVICPTSVDFVF